MQVSKVTKDILEWAAQEIGVKAEIDTKNKTGTRYRVKLYPIIPDSAWQIDKSRPRKCPRCRGWTKIIEIPKQVSSFLFIPDRGQLLGECGCSAQPGEWANWRRWKDERGDSPYQRMSANLFSGERRVNAVCWHGFRDYFRDVFTKAPNAIFRTALDTWHGSEDFEARYRDSGYRNIGSRMHPIYAADACRCPDSGIPE